MFTSSGTHNDFKPKTNQIDKHYSISSSSLLSFRWSLNKIVHDDQVTKLIWTFPINSLHITNPKFQHILSYKEFMGDNTSYM